MKFMKPIFTILTIVFFSNMVSAQSNVWWFDAGIKAGYGAAGLYNKNVTDSKDFNNDVGSTYSYGAKASVNFDNNGFTVDVMLGKGKHIYNDVLEASKFELEWNSLDIYALYRNNRNITYFELGPKLSLLKDVSSNRSGTATDVTSLYNANEISGVFGFGWYAMGNDGSFSGILGLRLEYGITDFVSSAGKDVGAPISEINIDPYSASNRMSASIVFELNWGIGYFGKAQCGARSKFISF